MASNLSAGIPLFPYGKVFRQVYLPQEASTQLWMGGMASTAADGGVVPATTAGSGPVVGVNAFDQLSVTGLGTSRMNLLTDGIFIFNAGVNAPTDDTPFGSVLYAETDNTVGTGAGGQTIAGRFMGFEDDGRVRVFISSCASWMDGNAAYAGAGSANYKVRAVVTTLEAYAGSTTGVLTASSNGIFGGGSSAAQDGVTLAVGDLVFIQPGTTNITANSDAGPYVVTALGASGSKWVLTRPSWWATGSTIVPGSTIDAGGEGLLWAGTSWRSFAAKASVVDTTDAAFYVGRVTVQVTLTASGNKAVATVGLRSVSATQIAVAKVTNGGTISSTVRYELAPGSTPFTVGYVNTATATVQASVAAGTANTADQSVVNVTITNW